MDRPEPIDEEALRLQPVDAAEVQGAPAPAPEREVFWGYTDLCLFVCFFLVGMVAGALVVKIESLIFHFDFTKAPVAALLPAQLVTYAIVFGGLALMFQLEYGRPFWRSLGWTAAPLSVHRIVTAGVGAAMMVMLAGRVVRLPETSNPMTELLDQGNLALVLMAVFGVGIAPLCEELAFRGFLQPLLVRSFGVTAGILIAAVAFGLLHFHEYGNSWRHALLLSGAGACFGWMRHIAGSTKASVIMHASYNGLLFFLLALALVAERNHPH